MSQVPKADAVVAASPTPPLVGMVNFAKGSSSVVKKPFDVTMAADNVVVVNNSNNIPTSTSGDSTTDNGTNSRNEDFVIQSNDIDNKL